MRRYVDTSLFLRVDEHLEDYSTWYLMVLLVRHTCTHGLAIGFNKVRHLLGTGFCDGNDWLRNYKLIFLGPS